MEVVLGLFVLWSWTFWFAMGIGFLLLFATVEQYIQKEESLKGQVARPLSILMVILALVIWANNPLGLWHSITEHWLRYIIGFVPYLVVGSLWSFNRWRMTVNAAVERYKNYMTQFINGNNQSYIRKSITDFKPSVDKWKASLVSWIIFWPISILRYLFGSFLIDMLEGIFNKLRGIYQNILDKRFSEASKLESQVDTILTERNKLAEEAKAKKP